MAATSRRTSADLCGFIDACPSPFHAVAECLRRLDHRPRDEGQRWDEAPGRWAVARGGSLVAWAVADHHEPGSGFRIVGAHTDSPNLRVKPRPDGGRAGFRQIGVEVYGAALLNSWLDRDLGVSGRVVARHGASTAVELVSIDEPLLRIPQLAIHLDRDVNDKGLVLDRQQHLAPVWATGPATDGAFAEVVAASIGRSGSDLVSWDLMLHDLTPSTSLGAGGDLISAPRLDNLASCHAAVSALAEVAHTDAEHIPVVCLFDHEEVGSVSARGAASSLLPTVLARIVTGLGGDREDLAVALARSVCVSADGAHATHPNYPDRHEPDHTLACNAGPAIKRNSNERYATDAVSHAAFVAACDGAEVPHQVFVNRSNLACGSTIGPITAAQLGIPTVDAGIPQLAMHSARELCGADDPDYFAAALTRFLRD